jgi:cytochrome oxidase Cu insertion factor (SCO1/SenC/PrrC family)
VSSLSDVQFSRFTETEVAKLLTFGRPRGALEVMVPMSDDERRDLETHLKEHFRLSLAVQVKASHVLYPHGRVSRLQKRFFVKRERLIEDLFFWYFFGFKDLSTAAFRAPVFLVPSHIVHTEAEHQVKGNIVDFNFVASMNPSSKDHWRPYACDPAELAGRVVKFLRAQENQRRAVLGRAAASVISEPGTILVCPAA